MLRSRTLPFLALLGLLAAPAAFADSVAQTLPFAQNWSNAGLITVNDNWTGVPGIEGFLGDDASTTTAPYASGDPQTVVTVFGAQDVIANQTTPNTNTTGGVAEFAITDPVVAFQGSGTADAPYLILYLNTTGASNINVAYNLRDIDGSADNSIQPVALQYRVGNTGNFTNVPAGFVADASSGPSLATLVTPVSATLPAAADNQSLVQVRIITINAVGSDEWIGIDDIGVTGGGGGGTTLSINDVAVTEGDAGTVMAMFTVSLSAPAGAGGVTFDIATADGVTNPATLADNDYVMNSLVGQTIAMGNSTFAFSVTVNGDMAVEANETFLVNVTNVTGATLGDGQGVGTINNDDVALTPIHDIQGPGAASPLSGTVSTRGIVTGVKTNGFFIQEPDATIDANPLTSEGILVFTSSAPPAGAVVGALVQVTGTIAEFVPSQDPLQPPLTELTTPTVVQISTGNPLPAAIPLTPTLPDPAGVHDQLERLEGMRVSVASLTVSGPTLGNVNEPMNTATSSGVFYGVVTGVARPFREAGIPSPDPAPAGTIPPIPRFDSNPERIRVDSDSIVVGQLINVGFGQTVSNLVGPLDYTFRTYTINPEATPTVAGATPETAVSTPSSMEFTISSYNLERFFDTTDDPGVSDPVLTPTAFNDRLLKASRQIRNFLKTPDILGIVEIENLATLQGLATQINTDAALASQPNPMYQAFLVEGNDIGGIDVGFLVKTAPVFGATPRVSVTSVTQELDGTLFVNADASTETLNDRPPLRLNAVVNHPNASSYAVTVIVNHLRSLNSANSTAAGSSGWATAGDRVRAKRQKQAEDLANLVQARQIADPMERIVLIGDFNAFEFNDGLGDSMSVIGGTPTPDNQTVVPGDGIDLVNPDFTNLASTTSAADRYSFIFDGNAQSLDHILVNQALVNSTMARREEHSRINADFPGTDRNDVMSNRRLADHDPIVAFFSVPAFPVELIEFSIE